MSARLFAFDLNSTLTPENHQAVSSGYGVVQPVPRTVCGVGDCFSPPYAGRGLRLGLAFLFDGHRAVDDGNYGKGDCGLLYAGGTWRPDYLLRHGTYHQRIEGRLLSFRVESRLAALVDRAGYILEVRVVNRCGRQVNVAIEPQLEPGQPSRVALDDWDYAPPAAGTEARPQENQSWSNGEVAVHLLTGPASQLLEPGAEALFHLAVVLDEPGAFSAPAHWFGWLAQTEAAWDRRIADALSRLPLLRSDLPGLDAFYRRALLSGLVCLWENPAFVTQPFLATSGLDGGAICAYPWDLLSYAPHTTCILLGERLPAWIGFFTQAADLTRYSRYSPSGKGKSVPYAYNFCSTLLMLEAYAGHRGLSREIFDEARRVFEQSEKGLSLRDGLADWGVQHNLLEMRQSGWEHFVASPNAERAWALDRLAAMADRLQVPGGADWRVQAERIRTALREQLWNRTAGWFDAVYPDGARETVYSIQAYDALRFGDLGPEIEQALFAHLREGTFLGRYGISSISAEDELHYEANDPDWSGTGSYFGEEPNLAQTLWEKGRPELAWDVLRRYFWMGEHLLYYPQEAFCDRPVVPAHKRANIVAGLAGIEAVLFGLLGLRLDLDGTATFHPVAPAGSTIELEGLLLRGHQVHLRVEPDRIAARVDGREITGRPGDTLNLFSPA